jgi:hypothetical protein
MATKGTNQKTRGASPHLTKNGKTRLGPLNLIQLNDLIAKTSKPKEKAKIQRRIHELIARNGLTKPDVTETVAEAPAAE